VNGDVAAVPAVPVGALAGEPEEALAQAARVGDHFVVLAVKVKAAAAKDVSFVLLLDIPSVLIGIILVVHIHVGDHTVVGGASVVPFQVLQKL